MRYRIGESPTESAYAGSVHFVELTVFITLLIGIGFLFFGIRGKQSWMTIWGALSIIACATFLLAVNLGWLPGP